jgi:hypothetical protein
MSSTIRRGAARTLKLSLPLMVAWAVSLFEASPNRSIAGPLVVVAWALIGVLLMALAGEAVSSLYRLAHDPDRRRSLATAALVAGTFGTNTEGSTGPAYLPFTPAPTPAPSQTQVEPPEPIAPGGSEGEVAPTHTVVAGENFWLIARSHLQELWQRSPSNREVARFWLDLIAANRARLQSGDPDLIFPGEVFELPEAGPGA